VIAAEGLPVQLATRVLGVSESGYYEWRGRAPSARAVRHAWLTEQIQAVHLASRGTYGSRRVHAELRLGLGVTVGHGAVEMLMRRAGIKGLPGSRRPRPKHQTPTAGDLVHRQFTRPLPDQPWVTDITEHPTREGKVYCAVVLDACTRRVVGWSIDASQTAALVTSALDMAIRNRAAQPGVVIHSDHGVQGEFDWSSQHLDRGGVDGQASRVDDGADRAVADEVAGGTVASAGGRARILAGDRQGLAAGGGCARGRRVAGGRRPVVPSRWRHAIGRSCSAVWPLPVLP
jgi:hypothetical protein